MKYVAPVFLVLLCGFLFFHRLDERDLWSSHEGRAAQNAQTMLDTGRWGLPGLFDFRLDLQKPPLYYWLVAGTSWLRGGNVDAWSVRAPAACAALAIVFLVYFTLARQGRPRAGFVAAFALATMVHFTALSRTGRIDMPLALMVSVALIAYQAGWQRALARGGRPLGCWLLASVSAGLAVLLKGPIGLALPGAVIIAHQALEHYSPRGNDIDRLRVRAASRTMLWSLLWATPVFLAVALPWFLWANHATGGAQWRTFFLYHNVERAFGAGAELRAYPFWYYLPRLVVDLLPWSLLLPVACYWLVKQNGRSDPAARFGLVWLGAMLLLLSIAKFKRADYLVPVYPGAALLLGCWLDDWLWRKQLRPAVLAFGFLTLAGLFALGWWHYSANVLTAQEPMRSRRAFAAEIRRHAPRPGLVIFFRCEDHALAFRVGAPINTILEWENIDIWAGRPGTHYIVMPPECAADWRQHVQRGRLEVVACNEPHEQPLVFLRTIPLGE